MAKQKEYILDSKSLDYIEVLPDKSKSRKQFLFFLFLSSCIAFIFAHHIPSRYLDMRLLLAGNNQRILVKNLDSLSLEFQAINARIDSLYKTDSAYLVLLQRPVLSDQVLIGGTGGSKENLPLDGKYKSKLLDLIKLTEVVEAKVMIKTHTTSVIETSLKAHKRELKHTPNIHPLAPEDITRWGSGFMNSRLHPILNYFRKHEGLDLIAERGTPVYAPANGIIEDKRRSISFGNIVTISHGYGIKSLYAHLQSFSTEVGDSVSRGDTIGFVGSTGLSSGAHLHYEVHVNGQPVDPMNYIHEKLTQEEFELIVRGK
ncbi:MAG: M23 family metallopeptidase [Bacteroidota bacterium]